MLLGLSFVVLVDYADFEFFEKVDPFTLSDAYEANLDTSPLQRRCPDTTPDTLTTIQRLILRNQISHDPCACATL